MEQCEAAQLLFGLGKGSGTPKHRGELGSGRAVGSGLDWADGQLVHVISENEIPLRQSVLIGEVATATGLSQDHAGILLKHLSWDVKDTVAAWRERSRQLCEEVGFMAMLEPPAPAKIDATFLCKVCYCEEPESRAWQEACGHKYCLDCAEGYLKQAVEDGNGCLEKRCIEMAKAGLRWRGYFEVGEEVTSGVVDQKEGSTLQRNFRVTIGRCTEQICSPPKPMPLAFVRPSSSTWTRSLSSRAHCCQP